MSAAPRQELAVALRYDEPGAPRVTAKGQGLVAEQIMKAAREYDVPLYQDAELARLLASVELGTQIPRALYVAVAEVIAFAYRVSGRLPGPQPPAG
jgi:flagellar biosynthesis protein